MTINVTQSHLTITLSNVNRVIAVDYLNNHCISTIPSIAEPITSECTHGHTNIESISTYCNSKFYKSYKIIITTSISELIHLFNCNLTITTITPI